MQSLHVGHSYATKYYMGVGPTKQELESVEEERDLGVIITADLKSSSQCIKSAATPRRVIGMVRRNFSHLYIADVILYLQDLYPATSGVLHSSLVPTSC